MSAGVLVRDWIVDWTEFVFAAVTSAVGAIGGLGGAVLLVPMLVLTGTSARAAAPLGLVSVAAGSSAAGARQLGGGLVNHRLGISTELFASAGVVTGAVASGLASDRVLKLVLAAVAFAAGVLGARRKGIRNQPDESTRLERGYFTQGSRTVARDLRPGDAEADLKRFDIGGCASAAGAATLAGGA